MYTRNSNTQGLTTEVWMALLGKHSVSLLSPQLEDWTFGPGRRLDQGSTCVKTGNYNVVSFVKRKILDETNKISIFRNFQSPYLSESPRRSSQISLLIEEFRHPCSPTISLRVSDYF